MSTHTERTMFDALHKRYDNTQYVQRGNGIRWVCAEHVRNDAGFYAARTADFIAVDMWPGTGNAVHGHEVKVSRADWLSELRQPEKSHPFLQFVNHWWIAVPNSTIVKPDELPESWGLLVLGTRGLRAKVGAPRLHMAAGTSWDSHRQQPPLPRGFTAALLRSVAKTTQARAAL